MQLATLEGSKWYGYSVHARMLPQIWDTDSQDKNIIDREILVYSLGSAHVNMPIPSIPSALEIHIPHDISKKHEYTEVMLE